MARRAAGWAPEIGAGPPTAGWVARRAEEAEAWRRRRRGGEKVGVNCGEGDGDGEEEDEDGGDTGGSAAATATAGAGAAGACVAAGRVARAAIAWAPALEVMDWWSR